jgi:hypothetical protein
VANVLDSCLAIALYQGFDPLKLLPIAAMIEAKTLQQHPRIGEVLPLSQPRLAQEMPAGRSHKAGKIVLVPGL